MGCGASVSKAPIVMASPLGCDINLYSDGDEARREVWIIQVSNRSFTETLPDTVDCDDIIEFQCLDEEACDIIQVYRDGNDFYEVPNGYQLQNINNMTPNNEARILLSLAYDDPKTDLYFYIRTSQASERENKRQKYSRDKCERNHLTVCRPEFVFKLTDAVSNQKLILNQGDTAEFIWSSPNGSAYRIEEFKYCPVSGGFYEEKTKSDDNVSRATTKGKFTKTFAELGMSFLVRFDENNQVYDINVCVVDDTYRIKRIKLNENEIKPNLITIEQSDCIEFQWDSRRKLTFYQIDPFRTDSKTGQSIKMKKEGENFFWPHDATRRGQMYYQFHNTGIYCFQTDNKQIGTIIVEPRKKINRINLASTQLVFKMNTNDLLQFEWKIYDFKDHGVFITLDGDSSVVPDDSHGLKGVFGCSDHRCSRTFPIIQQYLQTSGVYLLSLPKHGLYNFSRVEGMDMPLLSIVVENGIDNQYVRYGDDRNFEADTIIINQNDQVWFDSTSTTAVGCIYETDEYGVPLSQEILFEPQRNSVNYYMKQFNKLGIFYFSVDFERQKILSQSSAPVPPLAIIVIPDIKFHYQIISKKNFNPGPIVTNVNDFVIWKFDNIISHNLVQLSSNSTVRDLGSCDSLAKPGRSRECLALECVRPGTYFFANPEFERIVGSEGDRLVSTIVIDVPFGQRCFVVTNHHFVPDVLHIAQNETISWALLDDQVDHQISVELQNGPGPRTKDTLINRNLATFLDRVHHLHTFSQTGTYIIRSSHFQTTATVLVDTETNIRQQRKRVLPPELRTLLDPVSEFSKTVQLTCPNRDATIYYTLDGLLPTRFMGDVRTYNPPEGIILIEPGLRVIRAFAAEKQKVSSDVLTTVATYVMENQELEGLNARRKLWNSCQLSLSAVLQRPNKIFGTIDIQPNSVLEILDHCELYINQVPQRTILLPQDLQFSAEGFAGGEQYEISVVAYPKSTVYDAEPISSNKRVFEIRRELPSGGPLVSLAVPNDQSSVFLLWPHVGDHVGEYNVYVDGILTKTISEANFNDFYGIQFLGAEENRNYLLHVEAKLKDNNKVCKSNVISVRLPLKDTVKGYAADSQLPYITINNEQTPTDGRLDEISDRISSSKLPTETSSSLILPPPPSPSSPAASSRPKLHVADINPTALGTSEVSHGKSVDALREDKEIQTEETTVRSPTPNQKQRSEQPDTKKFILSDEAKQQADILFNELTKNMELRQQFAHARCPHLHTSYPDITLFQPLQQRPAPDRDIVRLPVTTGFKNAVPKLSYKRNKKGITCILTENSPATAAFVEHYRLIVDGVPYGKLITPRDSRKFQVNLPPGNHECYLEVTPKEKDQGVYKSNLLKINVPSAGSGTRADSTQKEPSNVPIHSVLDQKDLPVTKLNVQVINTTSIRARWHLDRGLPKDTFVAIYELHMHGQVFSDQVNSDEKYDHNGSVEHVWNLTESFLEISGVSDREEYTLFVRTYYHVNGLTDIEYVVTQSNEVTTARLDPLVELLPRPILSVARLDLQMVELSWKLPETDVESLVKGYRLFLNSKPTEILPASQHQYEVKNIKPGTTNEIQVAVTASSNFADEQISEPIRVECPLRPQAPQIKAIRGEKPFSIMIQWEIDAKQQEEISSFRVFLNNKLHGEIPTGGRQTFKYEFTKLESDENYSIYVKSVVGAQKLDGYSYQCSIESKASNEIVKKCAAPLKGTMLRMEKMHPKGIEVAWDEPEPNDEVNLTGYQILKDGRAVGKPLPLEPRHASVSDLDAGNRYSFQLLPLTDQLAGTKLRPGEAYDPNRHTYCVPGPKLEVEYTDLVQLPKKIWIENITGHTAMLCWSPIDQSSSSRIQPDYYKVILWNDKDIRKEEPRVVKITKNETSARLSDLQSNTNYQIQIQTCQKRRHPTTNDQYAVVSTSDTVKFQTGAPPKPPSNIRVIACTNTAARIAFDPFVERNAEIITLRLQVKPSSSSSSNSNKPIILELAPDANEAVLMRLLESTSYEMTLYAITEEYLQDIECPDVSQLRDELPESEWLTFVTSTFTTSGCKPAKDIQIKQATIQSIELEWEAAQVTGSTVYLGQVLRWRSTHGEEHQKELNKEARNAKIPGILPSGRYTICLDTLIRMQVNLEDAYDETNQKEIRLTTTTTADVTYTVSSVCEPPDVYLTGYSSKTIDLAWNKPNMFNIIDHPERIGEQIRIHRQLHGYMLEAIEVKAQNRDDHGASNDGKKITRKLSGDKTECQLVDCRPGGQYRLHMKAQTSLQPESNVDQTERGQYESEKVEESPPTEMTVQLLNDKALLRSFNAKFEFNSNDQNKDSSTDNAQSQTKGKIQVEWAVSDSKKVDYFLLHWHSSSNLRTHQKSIEKQRTSAVIDVDDDSQFYTIELHIITTDKKREEYPPVTVRIPVEPDAPKLFLVKTTDTSFTVEWSEPRTYGIPIIGYELDVSGKRTGDVIQVNTRRVEIPSRINRTYEVKICAITNHPVCSRSPMSEILTVITTPTTNLVPTMAYHNDDGNVASFDHTVARIIPVQIQSINEDKLHIQWTSFLPTPQVRAYYIHYTCLNTGDIQAKKISKRHREAVLRDLRPGFTYGLIVLAVDKNGGVLYTSDKTKVQMNAPPNAPIVAIRERTTSYVRVEWRPAASYGDLSVVGYKIYVNNRLAAILSRDQLSYTLTNGTPCDVYTLHVQALSNDKNIASPMSRIIQFSWPGIKPGAFRRVDDGQTGTILLSWDHPQLEDQTEKLIGYRVLSENLATREIRVHGEYDAATHQASICDLNPGKYRLYLDIQSENYATRARPITVIAGRSNSAMNRTISYDSRKLLGRSNDRFRTPVSTNTTSAVRQSPYS